MHSNRGNCEVSNRIYDYGLVKRKYIENVVFENFVFTDSTFAEIKISKCTFKNCKFIRCHYYDSPIHNNKFVDCYFEDVTLYKNLDVKGNFSLGLSILILVTPLLKSFKPPKDTVVFIK